MLEWQLGEKQKSAHWWHPQKPVALPLHRHICLGMMFSPVRGSSGGSISMFQHTSLSQLTLLSRHCVFRTWLRGLCVFMDSRKLTTFSMTKHTELHFMRLSNVYIFVVIFMFFFYYVNSSELHGQWKTQNNSYSSSANSIKLPYIPQFLFVESET